MTAVNDILKAFSGIDFKEKIETHSSWELMIMKGPQKRNHVDNMY